MKWFSVYHKWTLIRQLQVKFIVSALLLCWVLVSVTYFQLNWLYKELVERSETMLLDSASREMAVLCKEEAAAMSETFSLYLNKVRALKVYMEAVQGHSHFDLTGRIPYMHDAIPFSDLTNYGGRSSVTLKNGVFYCPHELSSAGSVLVDTVFALDLIVPHTLYSDFHSLYAGFETDDISYYYPGYKSSAKGFTPRTRE